MKITRIPSLDGFGFIRELDAEGDGDRDENDVDDTMGASLNFFAPINIG